MGAKGSGGAGDLPEAARGSVQVLGGRRASGPAHSTTMLPW